MRKVFLSFLGTTDYLPCNYQIAGYASVANVRFVQEACVARWCADWGSDDRIFLCVTDESLEKNWLDNGHRDKNILERQGLASRLEGLHLAAPVEPVMIPAGRSEEEIWAIFERVFSLLEEGDHLYLDITHAFRSLPMLAMVILSYAKVMRTVSVRAISYGALEARGTMEDVKKMPEDHRHVPVFDLLPFDRLQDWVIAVDRFTATGDGKMIRQLADQDIGPLLRATEGRHVDVGSHQEPWQGPRRVFRSHCHLPRTEYFGLLDHPPPHFGQGPRPGDRQAVAAATPQTRTGAGCLYRAGNH